MNRDVIDLSEVINGELDIELLKRTPSSFLGSCRYKLPDAGEQPEVYESLFQILKRWRLAGFSTLAETTAWTPSANCRITAQKSAVRSGFIGVPKTIDNDLEGTDHTPGFGSAAKYIGTTIKEIVRDSLVYDMRSVTIVEIMGAMPVGLQRLRHWQSPRIAKAQICCTCLR